jgi:hypothetical protein
MKNCHKPEETRETWQLDALWYVGLNPGKKEEFNGNISETQIKSKVQLIVIHQCQLLNFDKCTIVT